MASEHEDEAKLSNRWLLRLTFLGFVGGACVGTIINDVVQTHGATLWCAPIGIAIGFVAGLLLDRLPRKPS